MNITKLINNYYMEDKFFSKYKEKNKTSLENYLFYLFQRKKYVKLIKIIEKEKYSEKTEIIKAMAYRNLLKPKKAIKKYKILLSKNNCKQEYVIYNGLALAYSDLNDKSNNEDKQRKYIKRTIYYLKKAIKSYEKLKEKPPFPYPYYLLATMYVELKPDKKFKKIIRLYKKSVEIEPKYINSYLELGDIYLNSRNEKKALNYYKLALKRSSIARDIFLSYESLSNYYKEHDELSTSYKYAKKSMKLLISMSLKDVKQIQRSLIVENFDRFVRTGIIKKKHFDFDLIYTFYIKYNDYIRNKLKQEKLRSFNYNWIALLTNKKRLKTSKDNIIKKKDILGKLPKIKTFEKKSLKIDQSIDKVKRKKEKGFIIFIDLCNSSLHKQENKDMWFSRLLFFYEFVEYYFFKCFKYCMKDCFIIKYIGDEILLYINNERNHHLDVEFLNKLNKFLTTLRFELNHNFSLSMYKNNKMKEYNYEKDTINRLDIKTCITYFTDIHKITLKNNNIDILGTPVDLSARLMSLSRQNTIICNFGYYDLFKETIFNDKFINLGEFSLKGFDNYPDNKNAYLLNCGSLSEYLKDKEYVKNNSKILDDILGRYILYTNGLCHD